MNAAAKITAAANENRWIVTTQGYAGAGRNHFVARASLAEGAPFVKVITSAKTDAIEFISVNGTKVTGRARVAAALAAIYGTPRRGALRSSHRQPPATRTGGSPLPVHC